MKQNRFIAIFFVSIGLLFIQGCGNSNNSNNPATAAILEVTVNLPSDITLTTLPSPGELKILVSISGGTPLEMTLTGDSATYLFNDLNSDIPAATYQVSIEYQSSLYTSPVTLATTSKLIDLNPGGNILSIEAADFNISIDTDLDKKTNLVEVITGSNPFIPVCKLGENVLGNCELET